MPNKGIAPADLTTDIGQFRQKSNDLIYSPLDPVEPGYGDYRYNSDEDIASWLEQGQGSVYMSLGFFYLSLAAEAAVNAKNIKDHDLAVNTTERADKLTAIAQKFFDLADEDDTLAGGKDIFEVVPTGGTNHYRNPELAYGLRIL